MTDTTYVCTAVGMFRVHVLVRRYNCVVSVVICLQRLVGGEVSSCKHSKRD